ncbi:MAG TPA: DUF3108 domain-containing protein [Kofleriaceae bacterium]
MTSIGAIGSNRGEDRVSSQAMSGRIGVTREVRCVRARSAFNGVMRTLALVVVCSCNRFVPAPPQPVTAHAEAIGSGVQAVPGEAMEFRATARGIEVGIAQTAIGRAGWIGDRHAIVVRTRATADGLVALLGEFSWELSSTIDLDAGVPIEDREQASARLISGEHDRRDQRRTWDADDRVHDIHSAVGAVRAWHSEPGASTAFDVEVGGGRFTVSLRDAGRELHAGKPAVRYEGSAAHFPFVTWVSDDEARVPLAFHCDTELGTVAVELVAYDVVDAR